MFIYSSVVIWWHTYFVCYGVKMEIKSVIQIFVVLEEVALHAAQRDIGINIFVKFCESKVWLFLFMSGKIYYERNGVGIAKFWNFEV